MIAKMMGKLTYILYMLHLHTITSTILKKGSLIFWCCTADQEKEREEAQATLNKALLEKEQVSGDLNAMERSFSELFKRLEKYKEVIEGYKKVRKHLENFPCYRP